MRGFARAGSNFVYIVRRGRGCSGCSGGNLLVDTLRRRYLRGDAGSR